MNGETNLLIILTDQQRFDTLACYGNAQIDTPNLNRFAEQAVIFDETYCATPICAPSRGTLLTGLWAHEHGVISNWEQPMDPEHATLPQLAAECGKPFDVHGYMGKWHLGPDMIERCGFDEVVTLPKRKSVSSSAQPPFSYEEYADELGESIPHWSRPTEHSMPGFLVSRAIDFIDRHASRRWMLQVSFDQPHPPYRSCRDGSVDPDTLPLPANFLAEPTAGQPDFISQKTAALQENLRENCDLKTEQGWRELMACYWGNMSNVDFHVGRLLDTLKSAGLMDNTLIVFTSDHGEMMGSHKLLHKAVMFQEAVRVPMLIRLPGQRHSGRIDGPVSQIDFVPTLLDLSCSRAASDRLPGQSLGDLCRTVAQGKESQLTTDGEPVFIEWHANRVKPVNTQACKVDARTVITRNKMRYTVYADGQEELYDLGVDPQEMDNLARPGHEDARIPTMRNLLIRCKKKAGDTARFPQLDEH